MRFRVITVLCACLVLATVVAGDGLRSKAKLLGKLAAKIKHHKRGVFSAAPPYKYGHDIPHVTHSIVKPIVVSYPPTASVTAVKVPLQHPLIHRYPVHVGHKVPLHSYAHRFPHTKVVRPDQHFHHHHHHVAPRPVVPILPAQTVPVAPAIPTLPVPIPQPSVVIPRPLPAPAPVAPIIPATPQFILPQNHVHLKPVLPAPVPIQPAPAPLYHYAPQYSYAIRPGNAVQTSYFATYPRYPLSFQQPLVPLAQPAVHLAPAPTVPLAPSVAPAGPLFLERPQEPHYHVLPQAHAHGVVEQPAPAVAVEHHQFLHPTAVPQPTLLHAHPTVQEHPVVHEHPTVLQQHPSVLHQHPTVLQATQPTVHVDHNGWAPVPHGHDLSSVHQDGFHQDLVPTQETHFAQPHDHFTQEQAHQVFEHHTGEEQYHEYQHQLQHHIQQQIEQAQYEQNLHNHQLAHAQPDYPQNHDFSQHGHDFSQGQDFSQHGHDFAQGQDFSQGHDFSQGQDFAQHGHDFQGQDFSHTQEQPHQEYGAPHLEGRSEEGEDTQKYHNHIPLGLQPPLDRPLDHFR